MAIRRWQFIMLAADNEKVYGGKFLDTILHIYKLVVVQSNVSLKEAEELSPGTVLDLKREYEMAERWKESRNGSQCEQNILHS